MVAQNYQPQKINDIIFKESSAFITAHPFRFLSVSFLDFLQFNNPMFINPGNFNVGPMQNLFIDGTHPEIPGYLKIFILLILRIFYWLFLGFVIWGLISAFKDWKKFGWLILMVFYFNFVYSAVYGLPRYAIPIYPFYILLFVIGCYSFFKKYDHLLFWRLRA
jgi:hypothetical protein